MCASWCSGGQGRISSLQGVVRRFSTPPPLRPPATPGPDGGAATEDDLFRTLRDVFLATKFFSLQSSPFSLCCYSLCFTLIAFSSSSVPHPRTLTLLSCLEIQTNIYLFYEQFNLCFSILYSKKNHLLLFIFFSRRHLLSLSLLACHKKRR